MKIKDSITEEGGSYKFVLYHSTKELRLATIISEVGFKMGRGSGSMLGTGLYANLREAQARKMRYGKFIVKFEATIPKDKVFIITPVIYKQLHGDYNFFLEKQYVDAGKVRPKGVPATTDLKGGSGLAQKVHAIIKRDFDALVYYGTSDDYSVVIWNPNKYVVPTGWSGGGSSYMFPVLKTLKEFDAQVRVRIESEILYSRKNYTRVAGANLSNLATEKVEAVKEKDYYRLMNKPGEYVRESEIIDIKKFESLKRLAVVRYKTVLSGTFEYLKVTGPVRKVLPDFYADVLRLTGDNSIKRLAYQKCRVVDWTGIGSPTLSKTLAEMEGWESASVEELRVSPRTKEEVRYAVSKTKSIKVFEFEGEEISVDSDRGDYNYKTAKFSDLVKSVFPNAKIIK